MCLQKEKAGDLKVKPRCAVWRLPIRFAVGTGCTNERESWVSLRESNFYNFACLVALPKLRLKTGLDSNSGFVEKENTEKNPEIWRRVKIPPYNKF